MKVVKFIVNKEIVDFLNVVSNVVTTEEGNTYIHIPNFLSFDGVKNTLEVLDFNNLPEDLNKLIKEQIDKGKVDHEVTEIKEEIKKPKKVK